MIENDWDTFAKAMTVLAESLGGDLSAGSMQAYFRALDDLPIEQVEYGMSECLKSCRFFPKPVEIREAVEGSSGDQALSAWQQVEQAFKKAGYWTSVLFENGAIARAVEHVFGTWVECSQYLHSESPEMIRAKQKQFEAVYRQASRGDRTPRYMRGYCEANNLNSTSQWERGKPVQIGEQQIFTQPVWIQGTNPRLIEAEFDFYTANLIAPVTSLLERPRMQALAPGTQAKLLSAGAGEMVDPEEGRQIFREAIADLTGLMRMPDVKPMSEAERDRRIEELRKQAERISRDEQAIKGADMRLRGNA